MIYVTSDLHGWPVEKFLALLDRAGFSHDDTLYVLGDVIDRGPEGPELLMWMARQENVRLLLGNHEVFMLGCKEILFPAKGSKGPSRDAVWMLRNWMANGGEVTLEGLRWWLEQEPDLVEEIFAYVEKAPLYAVETVGEKKYILVHAGLGNFRKEKPLEDYTQEELIWTRDMPDVEYFDDATVIFGHTPTVFFGEQYLGRPLVTRTRICIDTGAACGLSPMVLRLEDGKMVFDE